ncbi:MAG TPA: hypothetical protein VKQ72_08170 [Aggregatilineales bacterium]|nr:hypothetical protein [Aggregatilineales bacterium]
MIRQSGDLQPVLALVSPLGDIVAANDSQGGPEADILAYELPFTGDYVIVARRQGAENGADGKTTGQYSLSLGLRGPGTAAQNTQLVAGNVVKGRLSDTSPLALYRMETGGALALSLDLGSLHRVARLRILTPNGALLSDQSGLSPLTISARLPDKGPFLVEASSFSYDRQPFSDFSLSLYRLSATIAKASADPLFIGYGDQRQVTATGTDEWFFIGHSGDIINVGITPRDVSPDTSVRISAPQDVLLYNGNLGAGINQNLSLAVTGIYDVELKPADGTPPLPYQFDLERVGANGNEFALYDTATDKGTLEAYTPATGTLTPGGLPDAWTIDGKAGQVVNLVANATTGSKVVGLSLQRPDGSVLQTAVAERTAGAVIQGVQLPESGRYRAVVFDSQGAAGAGGAYSLTYEDASGGELREAENVKGLAIPANAFAVWSLNVLQGALINVRLTPLSSQAWSPAIHIVQPDGRIIASSSGGTSQVNLLGVTAPVSGTYRIAVGGIVISTLASYDLLANVESPFGSAGQTVEVNALTDNGNALPRYENPVTPAPVHVAIGELIAPQTPDDKKRLDSAPPIGYGDTVRGEIAHGQFSDAWQFGGIQQVTVDLTATALTGNAGPDLTLYNGNGAIVHEQRHGDSATTTLVYHMPIGGPYKVLVRMGLDGGRYLMTLRSESVGLTPAQVAIGRPIGYGQTLTDEIDSSGAPQRLYFLGTNNDTVSVQVHRSTGDLNPAVQIIGPNTAQVAADSNTSGKPYASLQGIKLQENGVFVIIVQPAGTTSTNNNTPATSGRYSVSLALNSGFHLGNRGGGVIVPGQTVVGLLQVPNVSQTWLFTGKRGESVTFSVLAQGNPLLTPLEIQLQDSAGVAFADRQAVLTQGEIRLSDVILPGDGLYSVQISGGNNTPGAYQLTWTGLQMPPSGGAIHYDETVGGVFTPDHDADTWVFSGSAGDVISLALTYQSGDTFKGGLQLRAENGLALATVADLGTGAGARVDNLLLPFSGSYTLIVANPDTSFKGAGVYSLSLALQDSKARSIGTVLHSGQQGIGDLYMDDPVDTWVFEAQAGDVVSLSAQARDQFLKPNLQLRANSGTPLASAEGDRNKFSQAKIDNFTITTDGIYVASVTGGKDKTTGSYVLSLDTAAKAAANPISLAYGDSKEGLVADNRPRQYFVFTAQRGDSVTASATREAKSSLALVLAIQDSQGNLLVQSDANGADTATISAFQLPTTGKYALVVTRYGSETGRTGGRFKVTINGTPENRSAKGSLPYGQSAIGRLSDDNPVDRITFSGQAGDVVGIASKATSADLDTSLVLENSTGDIIASNDDYDGTNAVIAAALLPANDTYTIVLSRVGTQTLGSSGNYNLTLNRLYKVNATAAPTSLLTYGQRVVGTIDAQNIEAHYSFSGKAGDQVSVNVIHQMDDAPPVLSIQDPSGTDLTVGTLANGETNISHYTLPFSGLYGIVLKRPLDAKQVYDPYALTVSLLSSQAGALNNGGVLSVGDTALGTFGAGQLAHYWLFQGQAGQSVTIDLMRLNGNLMPSLLLISPAAQSLASLSIVGRETSGEITAFRLPVDGIYSLLVAPGNTATSAATGQYRLSLQASNAITAGASPIVAGQTVSGTLNSSQPQQQWSFTSGAGHSISARLLALSDTFMPGLLLKDSDAHILAEGHLERSESGQTSLALQSVLPAAGAYTLIASLPGVSGAALPASGNYRLTFDESALSTEATAAHPIAYEQPVTETVQQGATALYALHGSAGDALNLSLLSNDGTTSKAPILSIKDSSGRVLAQADPGGASEAAIPGVVLPSDGLYVVALAAPATTSYTLVVQRWQDLLAPATTSRTLTANQPLDGQISSTTSQEFWSFDAKAGNAAQLNGSRANGDVRFDLAVFGPSGFVAAGASTPDGKVQLGPQRLTADGKYTIIASRWLGAAGHSQGLYALALTFPTNVSGSNGGFIPAYGQVVSGGIASSGNGDTWTFDGQGGDVVDVDMTRLDGNLSPALKLLDVSGKNTLASAQSDQSEAVISHIVLPSSGRYSILAGRNGDTSGGYKLVVSRAQSLLQASLAQAEGISFGASRDGQLTKELPVHAYVFYGENGQRVTVTVTPKPGDMLTPYVYLLGPDGNVVAGNDGSGSSASTGAVAHINNQVLTASGFYGIVVTGSPAAKPDAQVGAYSVSVERSQPGATLQGIVTVGGTANSELTAGQSAHEWTFDAGDGKTIAAALHSTSPEFDATLSIVGDDGRLLASAPVLDGAALAEGTLPGPGHYAVVVTPNSLGSSGAYQLQVSYALAPSGGGKLTSGETVQGTLDDGNFTDAWHFDVPANAPISLDLKGQAGNLELQIALYAPDGTLIPMQQSSAAEIKIAGAQLGAGGTYTLLVSRTGGASGHSSGTYSLQINIGK